MSDASNAELENFRRQWQAEVSSRRKRESRSNQSAGPSSALPPLTPEQSSNTQDKTPNLNTAPAKDGYHEGWLDGGSYDFDDLESREEARKLGVAGSGIHPESKKEPQSALEHFERAVAKESQGNMQESLIHYRKAYKLDDRVDRAYRNKHFPPNKLPAKSTNLNPLNKSVTVPNTAHHSLHGSEITLSELVASFAGSRLQPLSPEIDGDPAPPCPIASVPHEIMVTILNELAFLDVASLMRTSFVCKHLAYLTHAEDAIWRLVCHDSKSGFRDMKHEYAMTHKWEDLPRVLALEDQLENLSINETQEQQQPKPVRQVPTLSKAYPSFLENFRARPRIRFSGVYISTVNYVRSGMTNNNSVYWGNSPVHMVTYYRYLRFYRDGSAMSLLTFFEPHDVVPLLHKDNLVAARKGSKDAPLSGPFLPAGGPPAQGQNTVQPPPTAMAVMREARKCRWKMSAPLGSNTTEVGEEPEPEGNVYIELEGPTRAYTYHMQLALRSVKVPGVAKNTKLAWRSFWSYNSITDDWGEFTLKNDRAYVFSRVKSWADA